jgi:hypothetical protein
VNYDRKFTVGEIVALPWCATAPPGLGTPVPPDGGARPSPGPLPPSHLGREHSETPIPDEPAGPATKLWRGTGKEGSEGKPP